MDVFFYFWWELWNNWVLCGILGPFLWACANDVDSYCVHEMYPNEVQASAISGLYNIFPCLALLIMGINVFQISMIVAVFASLAGFLYAGSYFFYFRSLFAYNDPTSCLLIWNISIPLVAIIAYFFFREELSIQGFFGSVIIFGGGLIIVIKNKLKREVLRRVAALMFVASIMVAVSISFQRWVYDINEIDFWVGFFYFCLGMFLFGISMIFFSFFYVKKIKGFGKTLKQGWFIFGITEGLIIGGQVFSQRAIGIAPNVGYASVLESFIPIYVMGIAAGIVLLSKIGSKVEVARKIYEEGALDSPWLKIFVALLMVFGVFMIDF